MDGTEVGVLKETHKISLASLLKCHYSRTLEPQVGLEVLSDLTNKTLERQLADQQLSGLLVPPYLPECNSARPVAMGLLDTSSCRCRLSCCLGGQLLPGGLSSSGLPSSLLSTCHSWVLKIWILLDVAPC